MIGGFYEDLPPPSDEDKATTSSVWSSSAKMAPPTLRKPSSMFAPPQTILKPQSKPKILNSSSKTLALSSPALMPSTEDVVPPQPALVGVTFSVVEECDPARPNDYEYRRERERERKAMEAEMRRELERKGQEEEEKERRERERERENASASRINISGEEAWKRRAAMSGGGVPRSPSPPPNNTEAGGFTIGKSETSGLGLGAGGQMTAAQRMMAKMGWKEGQGKAGAGDHHAIDG